MSRRYLEYIRRKPRPTANFSGRRFLVVDDIAVNREIAAVILRDTGAEVDFAEDGQECVERVTSMPADYYDLILMDLSMPVMDGLEATRRLRQMGTDLPIIALSSNVGRRDKQAALTAGMNAFVEKPIRREQLFYAIRACMDA